MRLGPVWLSRQNSAELTQLTTRGVDGLDAYFSRYLPQLVLAVMVPLCVGLVILTQDLLAAVIVLVTVPLIPVFMILIGLYTQGRVDKQWSTLSRLSGHFVDVVAGMSTLKAFGRAGAQAKTVREIGDRYQSTTMGVLRVSFLSALVLEVLAMLSVALVAVSIGLRLVDGTMTLQAGLLVLILVPEVYLPLRMVGTHFHAAAEGLGAARQMIEILEEDPPASGPRTDVPDLATATISFSDVGVGYVGREDSAVEGLSFAIAPGSVTALVGPSGCGKSTALAVLERFIDVDAGSVWVESAYSWSEIRRWWQPFGWQLLGQRLRPCPGCAKCGSPVRRFVPVVGWCRPRDWVLWDGAKLWRGGRRWRRACPIVNLRDYVGAAERGTWKELFCYGAGVFPARAKKVRR